MSSGAPAGHPSPGVGGRRIAWRLARGLLLLVALLVLPVAGTWWVIGQAETAEQRQAQAVAEEELADLAARLGHLASPQAHYQEVLLRLARSFAWKTPQQPLLGRLPPGTSLYLFDARGKRKPWPGFRSDLVVVSQRFLAALDRLGGESAPQLTKADKQVGDSFAGDAECLPRLARQPGRLCDLNALGIKRLAGRFPVRFRDGTTGSLLAWLDTTRLPRRRLVRDAVARLQRLAGPRFGFGWLEPARPARNGSGRGRRLAARWLPLLSRERLPGIFQAGKVLFGVGSLPDGVRVVACRAVPAPSVRFGGWRGLLVAIVLEILMLAAWQGAFGATLALPIRVQLMGIFGLAGLAALGALLGVSQAYREARQEALIRKGQANALSTLEKIDGTFPSAYAFLIREYRDLGRTLATLGGAVPPAFRPLDGAPGVAPLPASPVGDGRGDDAPRPANAPAEVPAGASGTAAPLPAAPSSAFGTVSAPAPDRASEARPLPPLDGPFLNPLRQRFQEGLVEMACVIDRENRPRFRLPPEDPTAAPDSITQNTFRLLLNLGIQILRKSSAEDAPPEAAGGGSMFSILLDRPTDDLIKNRAGLQSVSLAGEQKAAFIDLVFGPDGKPRYCVLVLHDRKVLQDRFLRRSQLGFRGSSGLRLVAFPRSEEAEVRPVGDASVFQSPDMVHLRDRARQTKTVVHRRGRVGLEECLLTAMPGRTLTEFSLALVTPFGPIAEGARAISRMFRLVTLVLLLFTLLLAIRLADALLKPIRELGVGVEDLAALRLDRPVILATGDELEEIARGLNTVMGDMQELALARTVQEHLLPAGPLRVGALACQGWMRSTSDMGGEWFDHLALPGDRLAFVVAGIAGQGISSALVMAMCKMALRLHLQGEGATPAAVLKALDQHLRFHVRRLTDVVVFLGIIDARSGTLVCCGAGGCLAFLLPATGPIGLLPVNPWGLGGQHHPRLDDHQEVIPAGGRLVVCLTGLAGAGSPVAGQPAPGVGSGDGPARPPSPATAAGDPAAPRVPPGAAPAASFLPSTGAEPSSGLLRLQDILGRRRDLPLVVFGPEVFRILDGEEGAGSGRTAQSLLVVHRGEGEEG
ncbi:MAG: SpoIIE family protein phosphatase [Candidatus Riflebacteria bacterium]|nr:SpoIIE family protein phosphatase [Candidatus Riflebacteria bacterium]